MIFIYFFKYETIETHARAFLALNISALGSVNCFGTLLTDNHVLTGATYVTNYKKYDKSSLNFQLGDEEGIDNWRILKVLNPTIFKIMRCDNGSFDRSIA